MVGQHHRAVRPAEHSCEIDDFQPSQRAGTLRRGFILGDGGSVVHAAASFECLSAGFGIDFEHLIEVRAMQHCHSLSARCFHFFAKKVFFNPVQGSVRNLTRASASAMP